jgi:hypothetical protein
MHADVFLLSFFHASHIFPFSSLSHEAASILKQKSGHFSEPMEPLEHPAPWSDSTHDPGPPSNPRPKAQGMFMRIASRHPQ